MVDFDYKLTVNDLIVEYMFAKIKGGYEPSFRANEFQGLIEFLKTQIEFSGYTNNMEELFKEFFGQMKEHYWSIYVDGKNKFIPHLEMYYIEEIKDWLIKVNYKFSAYDLSIINSYHMNKKDLEKLRKLINEYLSQFPKKEIDIMQDVPIEYLNVGKKASALIIKYIWQDYINKLINNQKWPKQCTDINKYLLEMDLAPIIGLDSIKKDLIEVYNVFAKRIAILYGEDKNLHISSIGCGLSKLNYELLIKGYEEAMKRVFNPYNCSIDIDVKTLIFRESHIIDTIVSYLDEFEDMRHEEVSLIDSKVYALVRKLDDEGGIYNARG